MNLRDIQTIEHDDRVQYFPQFAERFTIEYDLLALAGEVGEACNDLKKYIRGDFGFVELRSRLAKELPDILIYLVMAAAILDIDLEDAYVAKKEYNNRRYLGTNG